MRIDQIEIHMGQPSGPYTVIGPIKAQVGAATIFSSTPTMDEVNQKLREQAVRLGANAIVNVQYDRGVSRRSWKALTATGTAVNLSQEPPKIPSPTVEQSSNNVEARLSQLITLKEKGLISDTEYESKRRDVLSEI